MASLDCIDTNIACGLCASISPLEDYSLDNPFYSGVLFCDTCIQELSSYECDRPLDMFEYSEVYLKTTTVEISVQECLDKTIVLEPDEDQEEVELEMLQDEWDLESQETEDDFDLYDHFGISSELSEDIQDALLEAAMGSS